MGARITAVDDGALTAEYGGLRTLAATYRTEAGRLAGCCGLGPRVMAELAPSLALSPLTGARAEKAVFEAIAGLAEQAASWEASALAVEASPTDLHIQSGQGRHGHRCGGLGSGTTDPGQTATRVRTAGPADCADRRHGQLRHAGRDVERRLAD